MPLIDILTTISSEEGIPLNETAAKAKLIRDVNKTARALYHSEDLSYALYEQVFQIDETYQQFTLPWYVGSLRGARHKDSMKKIDLHDMRPRYQTHAWSQETYSFRGKHVVPNTRDIINATKLIARIPTEETFEIKITVQGSAPNKTLTTEVITIPIGQTAAQTENSFTEFLGPKAISKNVRTTHDIVVSDRSDPENIIAVIPNILSHSRYLLCQKHDHTEPTGQGTECYEVLYKHLYVPMEEDQDSFILPGDEWEDIIVLLTQSKIRRRSLDKDKRDSAKTLRIEALTAVREKIHSDTGGIIKTLDFGKNRYQQAFEATVNRYHYLEGQF